MIDPYFTSKAKYQPLHPRKPRPRIIRFKWKPYPKIKMRNNFYPYKIARVVSRGYNTVAS